MTAPLSWDDLDAQGCLQEGAIPDWSSLVVVGPIKRRGEDGHMALQWTVTVHCRSVKPLASVRLDEPSPVVAPVPVRPIS